MRRFVCAALALLLCASLACPAFAAEDAFVPSIGYKDHPEIVPGEDSNGDEYIAIIKEDDEVLDYVYEEDGCLVITSVAEAMNNETEIPEAEGELLRDVYEQISNGTMVLPFEDPDNMVIRDLIDVTFLCEEHPEMLAEEGVVIEFTFDLGVAADVPVTVLVYIGGEWVEAVSVVNNGDGTVTIVLEDVCPIAFAVPVDATEEPPKTGDEARGFLGLWIGLMVVSAAAVVVLVANRRKFNG